MKLTGEHIILRKVRKSDLTNILMYCQEKKVGQYTTTIPYPYQKKDALDFFKRSHKMERDKTGYNLAIELKDQKGLIGVMSLYHIDKEHRGGEIGYWLAKAYWNKGIASEALELIMDYGIGKLKLHKLHASVWKENTLSQRLLKKHGFRKEGILRDHIRKKGRYYDEVLYGFLTRNN